MERLQPKPKLAPEPAPEVLPRADVRAELSPTRCPYCHEGIDIQQPGWRACAGCLARHHGACWDELGHCGTCRGARAMVADTTVTPRETPAEWRQRLVDQLVAAGMAHLGSVGAEEGVEELPVPAASLAGAALGGTTLVESARTLAAPLAPTRCGTWRVGDITIRLANEGSGGLVRLRADLGQAFWTSFIILNVLFAAVAAGGPVTLFGPIGLLGVLPGLVVGGFAAGWASARARDLVQGRLDRAARGIEDLVLRRR